VVRLLVLVTGPKDWLDFAKYYCGCQTVFCKVRLILWGPYSKPDRILELTYYFVAWMDQSTISAHGRLLSNPSSREPSRPSSREPQVAQKSRFLHPEIHKHDNKEKVPPVYLGKILSGSRTDRHSSEYAFDTSSLIPDIQIDNPEHTIADQYDKSFGEEPHGKVTKCMVHGDECDGVSVGHLHLTETARQGCGFQEKYPTIRNGGREILDWFRIMNEERVKMGMVPIVRHA
jgi:hypothetical protein